MSYQKLERAAELYIKLQQLDEQIAGLEKIAMLAADGTSEVSLQLSILSTNGMDLPEKVDEDDDSYFNTLIPPHIRNRFNGAPTPTYGKHEPQQPKQEMFYHTLSDVVTLQILGMLMYEKKTIRKEVVERIKELNLV